MFVMSRQRPPALCERRVDAPVGLMVSTAAWRVGRPKVSRAPSIASRHVARLAASAGQVLGSMLKWAIALAALLPYVMPYPCHRTPFFFHEIGPSNTPRATCLRKWLKDQQRSRRRPRPSYSRRSY